MKKESLSRVDELSFPASLDVCHLFSSMRVPHPTQHAHSSLCVCVTTAAFVEVSLDQSGVNEHVDISERSSCWRHSDLTCLIQMRHVKTSTLGLETYTSKISLMTIGFDNGTAQTNESHLSFCLRMSCENEQPVMLKMSGRWQTRQTTQTNK